MKRAPESRSRQGSAGEVFRVFLKLGVTSFGGPIAHLGYFRAELVQRRAWLDDASYADLVALCQFLPGPASSQVGCGLGLHRAGIRGALAAFVAFTLPSAVLMTAFAWGASLFDGLIGTGLVSGFSGLPILAAVSGWSAVEFVDAFFRSGSLVFGGGHVVLPRLHAAVVDTGWVSETDFLSGYGAAQAMPGPLFTFAAFLGAISPAGPGGVVGAALALVVIFLPGFLLLVGVLPFWEAVRAPARTGGDAGRERFRGRRARGSALAG